MELNLGGINGFKSVADAVDDFQEDGKLIACN